jgi:hypothetical protein
MLSFLFCIPFARHTRIRKTPYTREQQKLRKYKVEIERAGGSVGVIVFDAFSRMGKEAEFVMKKLARNVDDPSFLRHMYTSLSFAVQRGNGKMLEQACLRCRLPSVIR